MILLADQPVRLSVTDWQRVRDGLTKETGAAGNLKRVIATAQLGGLARAFEVTLMLTPQEKRLVEAILGRREQEEAIVGSPKG